MLELLRRHGERIRIGKDITITFLGFNRVNQIKLGFDAPEDVKIMRSEIIHKFKDKDIYGKTDKTPETNSKIVRK